jgi:hypothetical protein
MRFRPDERLILKRLALLWLTCAAVGFAVAACTAVVIALAFDRISTRHASAMAVAAPRSTPHNAADPPRAIDTGRRLLGE